MSQLIPMTEAKLKIWPAAGKQWFGDAAAWCIGNVRNLHLEDSIKVQDIILPNGH